MLARAARTRCLAALMALALLFAQQLAAGHALRHLAADAVATSQPAAPAEHGLAGDGPCLKCLLLAQIASALPAPRFALPQAELHLASTPVPSSRVGRETRRRPPARAPPPALR